MKLALKNSLSLKLLRVVLLSALAVGTVLSCAQIVFNAHKARQAITADAEHILAMFRDPSTQALYSLDREMGMQVVEGLFQYESVRYAAIGHPAEMILGEKSRALRPGASRWLTDPILGKEATHSIDLTSRAPHGEYYGDLTLTLDTATYGEELLINSAIVFITGILRALALSLVLYFVYYWLLTRPLATIIHHLSNIDPNHPGRNKLPMLTGNENNELGLWINTANNLLASIEHNARLRDEAEHSLQRIAQYDFLTGLPTRQLLQLQLQQVLLDAKPNTRVAVLCLGLDDFKGVNEQYSYLIGDQLLLALSEHLLSYSGKLGALARLGGDQFALIQPHLKEPYEAAELAQSVLDGLDRPFILDGKRIQLRATIGITLFPEDDKSPEKLLQKAEQTMTLAKRGLRNRYQFYVASVDIEISRRRELEKALREALAREELFVVYQPQIDYRTHQVVGLEALLRWRHPTLGMVSPDHFIPLAEQNGSILAIGQWVLEQACSQLRQLHDMGYEGLRMAVNLSAVQLHHVELPQKISQLLERHHLPPGSLELEVTETSLMQDVTTAAEHLLSLRQCGALIAIDDFGTGYSSLSYLKSLPLDKIKIDKSFVQDIEAGGDDAAIVRAIIQLAHGLGMQVIAEGVETLEQEAYIMALGCNEGQGYLYSQPLPVRILLEYLKEQRARDATLPSVSP